MLFHIVINFSPPTLSIFEVVLTHQKGRVRKKLFRETLSKEEGKLLFSQRNSFLTLIIRYPLFREYLAAFTKLEETMQQLGLIPFDTLPPRVKYSVFFQHLPSLSLREQGRGRRHFPRDALLKALIYKTLRRITTLTDLPFELHNNPSICQTVGLNPYRTAPSIERFSQFLRETLHTILGNIRNQLVHSLMEERARSGNYLVMDSCSLVVKVRENNLKTSVANRFDKSQSPKGDPDARVGILIHFPRPFTKEVRYFWGYRNHIVADAEEELPLWEVIHPADVSETSQAIPLLRKRKKTFSLRIEAVGGDAIYDTEKILRFIINDLKARAVILRNPRNERATPYTIRGDDVYCEAHLPMYRKGKMTVKKTGVTYLEYCCPLHFGREKQGHLLCPCAHLKFINQKGCNVLIRLTPSIRQAIEYGSTVFKELYKRRTAAERVFSRLLSIAMQDPPVVGIHSIRNHCAIAHITVLLVALAAKRLRSPDKIRFVRSFVPNFLFEARKRIS
jgi:hypothetical protein